MKARISGWTNLTIGRNRCKAFLSGLVILLAFFEESLWDFNRLYKNSITSQRYRWFMTDRSTRDAVAM